MKRKYAFLCLVLAVLTVAASFCPIGDGAPKLLKLRAVSPSSSHTIDFTYNSAGNISTAAIRDSNRLHTPTASGGLIYIKYEYGPDKRVKKETTKYSFVTSTGLYTYNKDGSLKRVNYTFAGSAQEPNYTEYTWKNGKLVLIRCVETKGNVPFMALYCTYDAAGNPSKIDYDDFRYGRRTIYSDLSFDNRNSYVSAIPGLVNPYGVFYTDPMLFASHNVIGYHYTVQNINQYCKSTVEYNKQGYPVKQVFTGADLPPKFFIYK